MDFLLIQKLIDASTEKMTDVENCKYNIPNFNKHLFAENLLAEVMSILDTESMAKVKSHFGIN